MTITRRQTLIGAAATVAAAALPPVAVAEKRTMLQRRRPHRLTQKTYVRWDGAWPDELYPGDVIEGDLFEDHLYNSRWRYEVSDCIPRWVLIGQLSWSKRWRVREWTTNEAGEFVLVDVSESAS